MAQSILEAFEKTGALLHGHFILSSGLHSRQYFQCAMVLQHTELAAQICADLAAKLANVTCDAVISPAMGGIVVGQEVGRNLGKLYIFVEKQDGKRFQRERMGRALASARFENLLAGACQLPGARIGGAFEQPVPDGAFRP